MINVQLFHHSESLLPHLRHFLGGVDGIQVITPNPFYADIARVRFGEAHNNVETFTVAKFLKDELNQLVPAEQLQNFQGKSDLNLLLGSLWKIKKQGQFYELFKRSFQVLTDFRSFTLNEDILQTILENYDEELAGGVLWFHKVMEQMDVIDEHRSYFLLAERLRQGDLPPLYPEKRTFIFWGFDFLTGAQIDLLNALSIRNEIIIPFPIDAYNGSKDLDWIKWLTKFDTQVYTIDEKQNIKKELPTYVFPKNYLAKTLKSFKKSFGSQPVELVLGCKNLSDEFVSEIPFADYSYKVGVDIFAEKLKRLRSSLLEEFKGKTVLKSDELVKWCQAYARECIEEQDFRGLKATTVTLETFYKWISLSEHNENIFEFDIKIIFDSAKLDLPRNSLFSGTKGEKTSIQTLKTIEQVQKDQAGILCVTGDHGPVKGNTVQYQENVEQYLASIGPVRRSELEFLLLKAKIKETLSEQERYLFIEEGLLEHDLGWSSIISEFTIKEKPLPQYEKVEKKYYFPKIETSYQLNSISASKLQTYIDCPRKFHLTYGLKQRPRIELAHELNYMQLGLIEHEVIEKYLKVNTFFDEEKLNELIYNVLFEYEKKGDLQTEKKEEYWLEVKALCTGVIIELILLNNFLGLNLEFEKDISTKKATETKGSIDCFGSNQNTVMILDFKRGSGSIPSQVGLKDFQKIQLWFYLKNLEEKNIYNHEQRLIWGYINLSKLEDSLIYCSDDTLAQQFKDLNLKILNKLYSFDERMQETFEEYKKYERELLEKIEKDQDFLPVPKEVKVCQYCELASICPRNEGEANV